jgi:hypothetical protein
MCSTMEAMGARADGGKDIDPKVKGRNEGRDTSAMSKKKNKNKNKKSKKAEKTKQRKRAKQAKRAKQIKHAKQAERARQAKAARRTEREPQRPADGPGRNDPCPCGSGRKHKKCCMGKSLAGARYLKDDELSALEKLDRFFTADREIELALEESARAFWDPIPDMVGHEMEEFAQDTGLQVFQWWFWFDWKLPGGDKVVDRLLAADETLSAGEREFLQTARGSCLRLYEILDTRPGQSVTMRDVFDNREVTVTERKGSRQLNRGNLIAARVIAGPGGTRAVINGGIFLFSELAKPLVIEAFETNYAILSEETPGKLSTSSFFEAKAPELYEAWIDNILNPPMPRLQNRDGHETVWTTCHFDVREPSSVIRTLDDHPEMEREVFQSDEGKEVWLWCGEAAQGEEVIFGHVELRDGELTMEANSRERGERFRELIEAAAGDAVVHRATKHEDITAQVMEDLRSGRVPEPAAQWGPTLPSAPLGKSPLGETPSSPTMPDLPPAVLEETILSFQAQHYHRWVDEPVPALDGRTPREAASDPELAPKVEELIRGLEGMYEDALRHGHPAYDPSWIWEELDLREDDTEKQAPPLAHERWDESTPGWSDVCGKAAWALRERPDFDDRTSVAGRGDLDELMDVRRFRQSSEHPSDVMKRLHYGVNFELHRRKIFWVDEALAFMLAETNFDVNGGQMRVPFPAFALVFTDRRTLSLAERLLASDPDCPIRGYLLRTATVFVVEHEERDGRVLDLGFAFDTTAADPPYLVEHRIRAVEGELIKISNDGAGAGNAERGEPYGSDSADRKAQSRVEAPLPGLLRITLNAIMYAASPSSEKIQRSSLDRKRGKAGAHAAGSEEVFASDDVFHLPGPISISQTRQMQRLNSSPSGRKVFTRFMVRGHWRRPARSWKDQRMRWIKPHWKGPDIAALIEKTYRLEP